MVQMIIGGLTVQLTRCQNCGTGTVVRSGFRHLGHVAKLRMHVRNGEGREVTRTCPQPGERGLIVRGVYPTEARMRAIRSVVSDELRRRADIERRVS